MGRPLNSSLNVKENIIEDHYDLDRFVTAQGKNIDHVIGELKRGQKSGHWMWYIFPQITGLGKSSTSRYYAIKSREEAVAYLKHPVLGKRLLACTAEVNRHRCFSAEQIFGWPDYLKFRSCMTLFAVVTEKENPFSLAIEQYFDHQLDPKTVAILESQQRKESER